MKIGDIVEIKRKNHKMIGFVIRTYDNGSFYVKSIYDDFDKKEKKHWNRYGVTSGYFVSPKRTETTYRLLSDIKVRCIKYYTDITKRTTELNLSNSSLGGWSYPSTMNKSTSTEVYEYDDNYLAFTYVYLPSKDTGGFAYGIGADATKFAGYYALRNWLNLNLKASISDF